MHRTAKEFRHWKNKSVTLMGMSGVGKTRLARILMQAGWFHYSGDYRIGTRYLGEAILDDIKQRAMQVPFLRDLLRTDAIYIANNITIDNLQAVSTFLGKLGNPECGGLSLVEFKRRQALHHQAEIAAMLDVPEFMRKAQDIYGYAHFVNDAGGSLCELDDARVTSVLARHTLILYIKASPNEERKLIDRAETNPKPLYYRDVFLEEQLACYMDAAKIHYVGEIDPDAFVRWVFPKLVAARTPRYEAIASGTGYTIASDRIADVEKEKDFLAAVEQAIGNTA